MRLIKEVRKGFGMFDAEESAAFFGPGRAALWGRQSRFAHDGAGPELFGKRITTGQLQARCIASRYGGLFAKLHKCHRESKADKDGSADTRERFPVHG